MRLFGRGGSAFISWIIGILLAMVGPAMADDITHSIGSFSGRADGHAPIGVMGEHVHKQGEWMLSVRAMRMRMEGTKSGTTELTDAQVLQGFLVVPTRMDMDMLMIGGMFAPTDRLTLMAMGMVQSNVMDHLIRNGVTFRTRASGIGDSRLSGIYSLWRHQTPNRSHHLMANFGVSLPTGSINNSDVTPAGTVILPYPMQLGSGTVDLMPGLTYSGHSDRLSWGAQIRSTLRTGRNYRGYRLGNRFGIGAFAAVSPFDWISGSVRLNYEAHGNIRGRDQAFDGQVATNLVHTVRTDNKGGQHLDALFGINLVAPKDWGLLAGHRLAIEAGLPLWENLDGPQMATEYQWTIGWQKAF